MFANKNQDEAQAPKKKTNNSPENSINKMFKKAALNNENKPKKEG